MRLLLDTQCWLWMLAEPERLSAESRRLLTSAESELLVSAASVWEIAIKSAIGRLRLPGEPQTLVPQWLARSRTSSLPIDHRHALRVASLPLHHRDPFDRMLVAQSQVEGIPLLTADPQLAAYDIETLRA